MANIMCTGGGLAAPTLQTKAATPSTAAQDITPDSGYDGLSKVTVAAMPSGALSTPSVSAAGLVTAEVGTSGYLASGTQKTLQLDTQAAKTVTPSTSQQTAVASGKYTTGAVTVEGDANFVAGNIKKDVSIFGVTGTYEETHPTLNAPTISLSGSTLTITNPATNGNFATGYKLYDGVTLIATVQTNSVDLSQYITATGSHTVTAIAYGTGFTDSAASNSVTYTVASGHNIYIDVDSIRSGTQYIKYNGVNYGKSDSPVNVPDGAVVTFCCGDEDDPEWGIIYNGTQIYQTESYCEYEVTVTADVRCTTENYYDLAIVMPYTP